mmetsp:Transcript_7388/g.22831  ORF Transcript_7388/g.22831 Transcript_7388/m.22831 type:complete len:727 (+) Transcript_7388:104-2284(+)
MILRRQTAGGALRGAARAVRAAALPSRHLAHTLVEGTRSHPRTAAGGGSAFAREAGASRALVFSASQLRSLRALEDDANRFPDDPHKQLRLMEACNAQKQPHVAVRRFECGAYAADEAVAKEYLRALALSNQLNRLSLSQLVSQLDASGALHGVDPRMVAGYHAGAMGAAGASAGGVAGGRGTPETPLHIQWHESPRAQFWKMLRSLALTGALLFGAYTLLGDQARGLPRGIGFTSEVQPVHGSTKRFSDVCGAEEAIAELKDIVEYLRNPKRFTRLGGKLPKGVLLTGPPGTGKTLLARAVAGEAGVPFFYMSGSEFEEVFVGVGAKRVRDLFAAAKKRSPCIIFIDEIDAIGSHRNPKEQQAMKMTLNQLLVEMDGFQQNTGVIVIAATNFPEALDRALVRPGRFDTNVVVPLPDVGGRKQVLELYTKPVPLDSDVDLEVLARATPGFSGADLSNLVNKAALHASHLEKKRVAMADLEHACDQIRMGAERKSAVISPSNLKITAYHEGGHALVALHTRGAQPIHKATIVPRGNTLGMVAYLPEKDQLNLTREQMLAHIDICMGGRIAEELIFGKDNITTGASSDLQQATATARNMIIKYGMSDSIGPVYFSNDELEKLSAAGREAVEAEVKRLVTTAEANARRILTQHSGELHNLARGLLEHETLSPEDIRDVIAGRPLASKTRSESAAAGRGADTAGEASPPPAVKEKPTRKAGIFSRKVDQQ